MIGRIHSIDSMGLHDGPGIRFTVFMQGCPLRCIYCHNPDTWSFDGGTATTPEALFDKARRFKPWFDRSGGGVTVTGGEPLMQTDFITAFFRLCKASGIHTCLDTSGVGDGDWEKLLAVTDLVLLDLKATTPEGFLKITGADIQKVQSFHLALKKSHVPICIRHVIVPGLNDSEEQLRGINTHARTFPALQQVDPLPYHTLGVHKYASMGLSYSL